MVKKKEFCLSNVCIVWSLSMSSNFSVKFFLKKLNDGFLIIVN